MKQEELFPDELYVVREYIRRRVRIAVLSCREDLKKQKSETIRETDFQYFERIIVHLLCVYGI
jgi:hypothetical protein